MPNEPTIGARLRALQERSGLSLAKLAKGAGYAGASSIQRYFDDDYAPTALPLEIARKLADGFNGSPIARDELFSLAGYPAEPDARTVKFEGASNVVLRRDLPVYGTALGAPREIEGEAIEQTMLDESVVLEFLPRPTVLQNRADVYGFYIQGSSMAPRFEEGELGFAEAKRPPRVGDDVLVYLRGPDDHEGERVNAVLIKRLVRRTAHHIELQQFDPPKVFRIEVERVKQVHRVLPWREILS